MGDTGDEGRRPRLTGLVVGDSGDAWRAAGFTVVDDRVVAGGVWLRLAGDQGPRGVRSWELDPRTPAAVDGLAAAGGPVAPAADRAAVTAPAHPNGVVALDHVVVATDDVERTTRALAGLGLRPRRSVVGVRGDGDEEVAYRFFLLGTCVLELVGPTTAAGDGPARFAGLAFTTTAIDGLGALAGPPRDAVQPGRRIATLRGEAAGVSPPVAFLSPRPGHGAG